MRRIGRVIPTWKPSAASCAASPRGWNPRDWTITKQLASVDGWISRAPRWTPEPIRNRRTF